jgi:hypothetical protein
MSEAQRRPWLIDQISRRTYYRKKAAVRRAADEAQNDTPAPAPAEAQQ